MYTPAIVEVGLRTWLGNCHRIATLRFSHLVSSLVNIGGVVHHTTPVVSPNVMTIVLEYTLPSRSSPSISEQFNITVL